MSSFKSNENIHKKEDGPYNCKVLLSKIAPRGDVNMKMIDDLIKRVTIHHKCDTVDNHRAFCDKHGQLINSVLQQ